MLIGLGHGAQVGKDTAAGILVERHGFTQVAFADALRDIATASSPEYRAAVNELGYEEAKVAVPWTRQYLVDLGNACRRYLFEDVWVDAVFRRIPWDGDYVITDVRYPNELKAVWARGGFAVKMTRPGFEPLNNVADQALAEETEWYTTIVNDGTNEDLAAKLKEFVEEHRR